MCNLLEIYEDRPNQENLVDVYSIKINYYPAEPRAMGLSPDNQYEAEPAELEVVSCELIEVLDYTLSLTSRRPLSLTSRRPLYYDKVHSCPPSDTDIELNMYEKLDSLADDSL